tara:strand:- start:392 stop:610 length:219 start_codon:yes stop_codon:yes gene_type:complete
MKYSRQTQEALDRLDQALAQLRNLIKRNKNTEAIHFMEEGALKERFDNLQNIISISSTNPLGSRNTPNTGRL